MIQNEIELRIGGLYILQRKIKESKLFQIYEGVNQQNQQQVVIKLEKCNQPIRYLYFKRQKKENMIANRLNNFKMDKESQFNMDIFKNKILIQQFQRCQVELDQYLGRNLKYLFSQNGKIFSLKTVFMIADQLLKLFEYIHSKGIIHRNIKPSNICIGIGRQSHQLYMIDFSLSKKISRDEINKKIPKIGSRKFGSLNQNVQSNPIDDIESIGYLLLYFLHGSLPWSNLEKDKIKQTIQIKQQFLLTIDKNDEIIQEFKQYFQYCKKMNSINMEIDYQYLRLIFTKGLMTNGYLNDYVFDWIIKDQQQDDEDIVSNSSENSSKDRQDVFDFIETENNHYDEQQQNIQKSSKELDCVIF